MELILQRVKPTQRLILLETKWPLPLEEEIKQDCEMALQASILLRKTILQVSGINQLLLNTMVKMTYIHFALQMEVRNFTFRL